jgi:hypothetical protein
MPEEEYIRIPLVKGWQNQKIAARKFPLSTKHKEIIDRVFNNLQERNRFEPVNGPTPFTAPMFVAAKDRPVINLRILNKLAVPDAYPMPLQSDLIEALRGKMAISVIDGLQFFYQFLVAQEHRHRFTMISHRGLEQLNVVLMGFRNSVQHVQRFMDKKLKRFCSFVKSFVDDVVIFSNTMEEHYKHLRQVFTLFRELRLYLSAKKSFIGYPLVKLLGHLVNAFGMSTIEDQVAAF